MSEELTKLMQNRRSVQTRLASARARVERLEEEKRQIESAIADELEEITK